MTARLFRNPAVIVLGALIVLALVGLNWAMGVLVDQQGWSWEGRPTEEQLWQMRLSMLANAVPPWAVLTAVVALLGILVVGSASRRAEERSPARAVPGAAGATPDAAGPVAAGPGASAETV
jgi:hypothetical protein